MKFQTFILFICITYAYGADRQITPILNPGRETHSKENPLVYIKANSTTDTIHQIWDFTGGIPTFIYLIASSNSSLNITWDQDKGIPVEFQLAGDLSYSFAAAIDELYEYDDISDDGHFSPNCPQHPFSLRHLSWHINESVLTDKEAMLLVRSRYKDGRGNGHIDLKLDLLPFKDYAHSLPRLIHTANSSLVDVRLVNLTSANYNATRYALHLLLVSTDRWSDSWNYTMRKSLDDEHTPGVFEIIEIKSPKSSAGDDGGFLQFRPVAYTDAERDVSSSTNTHVSNFNRTSLPRRPSTLRTFYTHVKQDQLLVQDIFVSFGMSGDGYYKQHNYTAWSFTLGYGTPPIDTFSIFVVVVICIGLGVPIVLALSGVTYAVVRRYRQRNPPARLNNEE